MTSKRSNIALCACIVLTLAFSAKSEAVKEPAAQATGFVKRTMTIDGKTYRYQVFIPKAYDAKKAWPVVLSLHGSGEMGTDGDYHVTRGLGPVVKKQEETFPAIVVFPQTPRRPKDVSTEEQLKLDYAIVMKALDQSVEEYNADKTRIYLTGLSAGAYRAWGLACKHADRFAALVPIAGGMSAKMIMGDGSLDDATLAKKVTSDLKNMPIWMFHGSDDKSVPVTQARKAQEVFAAAGIPIKYTEYPNVGHLSWVPAYDDPKLWAWMWEQHKAEK